MRVERSPTTVERVLLALVSIALLSVAYEGEPCRGTPVLMYDSGGQYRADGVGSIVAAGHHLIGRTPIGTFFSWGDNRRRQSGTTGASPITFPGQVYGLDP